MRAAVAELKRLIRQRYPDATFWVRRSPEDARSIYLVATVDVPDTTEVLDVVLERVLDLQVREGLPVHVMPVRPRERVLAMLRADPRTDETREPPRVVSEH